MRIMVSRLIYIFAVTCIRYSKTCVKRPLSKRPKIDTTFQDQLSLDAGQKYCRMLKGEHSAILLTFIKLPFVIKIFVLSILSGSLRQVLLYSYYTFQEIWSIMVQIMVSRLMYIFAVLLHV